MRRVTCQLLNTVDSADLFGPLVSLQPPVCCHLLYSEWSCTSTTGLPCFYRVCGLIHSSRLSRNEQHAPRCVLRWAAIKWNTQLRCMHAFGPAKKSARSAEQRWGLFILQFRCKFVIPSPRMTATFCEAHVRYPTHTFTQLCTIPSSRKSLSGPMCFYHQIVCEEKLSAGIWTRVSYVLVRPPTHAEIVGLSYTNTTFKLDMFLYHL